jgi:hypothetical protein
LGCNGYPFALGAVVGLGYVGYAWILGHFVLEEAEFLGEDESFGEEVEM